MNRTMLSAFVLVCAVLSWAAAVDAAPGRIMKEDHGDKRQLLGTKEVAGYTVKVEQESAVKAGEEAAFVVTVTKGEAKPRAVRAWVGIASAEGSAKAKGVAEGEELHCHVEVPIPIPDKSQFWVELDTASGKHKVAFDYK